MKKGPAAEPKQERNAKRDVATLGGGCYWCFDALYRRVNGVIKVESGYSGGHKDHPHTMEVYSGTTGHAECVQVTFDPAIISYREILEIFFALHDPTTLNRQDYDIGDLYRSIIFYHDEAQQAVARDMIDHFAADLWDGPVVTQLVDFKKFWPADEDQQEFYEKNPTAGYCMAIIDPKIIKLRQKFSAKLKPES